MEQVQKNEREYNTIDILHILRALWYRMWIIIVSAILAGIAGFSVASFTIEPQYSSSILLYVNNNSVSLGSTSVKLSASDIAASQSLVKTYIELLKNRTTMERIIEKANVDYTYGQLYGMVEAGSSNETEIMKVTVTTTDPYVASNIANTIAEVLPIRISEIIEGASMEVVDSAIPITQKVSPSITKYTAMGMFWGVFISVAIIAVFAIFDDTIHDEEYIIQTYNYPILAKIPDLSSSNSKGYAYYNSKSSSTNNAAKR